MIAKANARSRPRSSGLSEENLESSTEKILTEINLHPKVTKFTLDQANEALLAVKNDSIDGAAVIVP
jgi:D-arabinose 1-dehydrogenase-like Zn-dependent alcohol dehydrogenase